MMRTMPYNRENIERMCLMWSYMDERPFCQDKDWLIECWKRADAAISAWEKQNNGV